MTDTPKAEDDRPCLHCYLGEALNQWMTDVGNDSQLIDDAMIKEVLWGFGRLLGEFAVNVVDQNQDAISAFFREVQRATVHGYNEAAVEYSKADAAAEQKGEAVSGDTIPEPESKIRH